MSVFRVRLILKRTDDGRLLYTVSLGFRFIFFGMALVVLASILLTLEGPLFHASNTVPLIIILVCLVSGFYDERWVFDRGSNLFEQSVGLIFLHRKKRLRLDSLDRVDLGLTRVGDFGQSTKKRFFARTYLFLSIVDREGALHKMDIARWVHLKEIRNTAEQLASFCEIPLRDGTGSEDPGAGP
ncbi:MAG TPA: hypothetical protein VMX75_05580 [Spirochaetia bacterium]|nr:hypothetical protein [Spirochaetia bacterium]